MTLMSKDVLIVIHQGHAIEIMAMRTTTNNPCFNKRTIIAMILVLVKNFRMILVNNNNGPSQVIVSQVIAMVMDSTEGDVDVHSHVVLIATTMMT